jgi:amino acid adenylation domain-containing protein
MLSINKRVLCFGETKLCIQCIEYLITQTWQIIAIVTDDIEVIHWANQKSISIVSPEKISEIKETNFYLFSIINPHLIPDAFLIDKKVKLAINYHDSLLPRYAGVNSTSFAIINGEETHGISLHKIVAGIDEGDLVLQQKINIAPNETSFSLNLKCSTYVIELFSKLIERIENDDLQFTRQNLLDKSYYGLDAIPVNYAIINGIHDYSIIDRLVRGLTFGDNYDNPVASVKVFFNDQFYIVEDLSSNFSNIDAKNKINNDYIMFNKVRNIFGSQLDFKITGKDLVNKCVLTQKELKYLSDIKFNERKEKNRIIKQLKNIDSTLTVLDYFQQPQFTINDKNQLSGNCESIINNYIEKVPFPYGENNISNLCALIYIVLARFFNEKHIVTIYLDDTKIPTKKLRTLVDYRGFIEINPVALEDGFRKLSVLCNKFVTTATLATKDFNYRFNIDHLTDIAITLGEVSIINKHKLVINIGHNELSLKGNQFHELQIKSIAECLRVIFAKYTQSDFLDQDLLNIRLLSDKAYKQTILGFSNTRKAFLHDKTIHQLFEKKVKQLPENIAVVCGNKKLTYRELNNRSNQLAHYLRNNYQINPDDLIALCLDKNEHMLVAILAVLKAGGAYVPIDPTYPEERIKLILSDTSAQILLTNQRYALSFLKNKNTNYVLAIDNITINKILAKQKTSNPLPISSSNSLAYVIYTSGTTGTPKGVLQQHNNIIRLFSATKHIYQFNTRDVWTLFHSYIFDFSIWEIFGALLHGGQLVIPSNLQIKDTNLFYNLCFQENITILNQTPQAFYQFINIASFKTQEFKLSKLRCIIFGGDKLSCNSLKSWFNLYGYKKPVLVNMYGITETTIHVTYKKLTKNNIFIDSNIGKAIPDQKLYILDSNLVPLPLGATGELYVGGAGLARGYLNQPELTANKFIANPYQTKLEHQQNKNEKLYKTGDRVRMLSNGNLEYIGRNDFQVKIRGYRIELGEIESILSKYIGVKQCVVLDYLEPDSQASKYLVAYYVAETQLNENDIFAYLKLSLPEYMLPAFLVHLTKLPLTINGKLDKHKLLHYEFRKLNDYVAPTNALETQMVNIWSEILSLNVNRVGIKSDFFKLGGNSILAIKLANRLNREFNKNINVTSIFKYKNITDLIDSTKHIVNKPYFIISQPNLAKEECKLSFAQERLWFIHKYAEGNNVYNTSLIYELKKTCNKLNLFACFRDIVNRHEILRTIIKDDITGSAYQEVLSTNFSIEEKAFNSQVELNKCIREDANYIFNLSEDIPIRVIYYKLNNQAYLGIFIHHIAIDGWSIDILLRDLMVYYDYHQNLGKSPKPKLVLPNLKIQYKDFSLWQKKYLTHDILNKQLDYWKNKLLGAEILHLPTDKPRPLRIDYKGKTLSFMLSGELSSNLKHTAKELNISLYSLLLSGFYLLLHSQSNQTDIIIGTPSSNRHYPQIENLIGFFVNALALRIQINNCTNIIDYIKQINHEVQEAQLYQDLPFERLVEEIATIKDISRHPIFQVMFGMENFVPKYDKLFLPYKVEDLNQTAKFDLMCIIKDSSKQLIIDFEYATSLFKEVTINGYYETYRDILEELSKINTKENINKQLKDVMFKNYHNQSLQKFSQIKPDEKKLAVKKYAKTNYNLYLENKIANIWTNILNLPIEKISTDDSFFKLGGNSILILKLKNQLVKLEEFRNVTVVDIFKYPTISQLVLHLGIPQSKQSIKRPDTTNNASDIAVISISGSFPSCQDEDDFWDLISSGKTGIKKNGRENTQQLLNNDLLQNSNFKLYSGHLEDIDKFDINFWGLTPHEANIMDPQIRKFVEHAWYLLEKTSYLKERSKLNIGVFAGSRNSDYLINNILKSEDQKSLDMWEVSNFNSKDALATQTSYLLGLIGSSNSINTGCSTGLVTIVEACQKLKSGICDLALAGAVSLILPENTGYIYQEGMILSQDGHCRVFDKTAAGTVPSSGIGVVLLKRLSDAERDQDNILAVIKGYASNNDGNRKINYTAPSVIGQKECIIQAQNLAGITSDQIDYVECHGTGTKLGDPIEVQALDEAFKCNTGYHISSKKCLLGSVKANIGHTDSAAGVAGLLKICKMLEHSIIPPQINYSSPNPELHLDKTNFRIITKMLPWKRINNKPRLAGISSFGIGGTNAHIIISDYVTANTGTSYISNTITQKSNEKNINYILPLSAKTKDSLNYYKHDFITYLKKTKHNLHDIAYILQLRREEFEYRLAISSNSLKDAINKLQTIDNISKVQHNSFSQENNVIFMFPGQGNQYANMSLDLYKNDSNYKQILDECIKLANKYTGRKFESILFPSLNKTSKRVNNKVKSYKNTITDINQTELSQIALFMVSYSLAKLLETMDVRARAYIGHSVGEWVAATLTGVFSLEDAIKLVVSRGKIMQSMPKGSMIAIEAGVDEVLQLLENNDCEISVINSPNNCVASGTIKDIEHLQNELTKDGFSTTILKVSHAYHSKLMDEATHRFILEFDKLTLNKPTQNFISSITGKFISDNEATDPKYWTGQIRKKILFAEGIKTLLQKIPNPIFIELGPGKSLNSFVKQISVLDESNTNNQSINVTSMLNSAKEHQLLFQGISVKEDILAKLWMAGYKIDFKDYYNYANKNQVINLPRYHFDSKPHWIKPLAIDRYTKLNTENDMFYSRVWKKLDKLITTPYKSLSNKNILIITNEYQHSLINIFIKKLKAFKANVFSIQLPDTPPVNFFSNATSNFVPDFVLYFSSTSSLNIKKNDAILLYDLFNNFLSIFNKNISFISISFNNFDVIGGESLRMFPSVSVGMTKSFPFENTKIFSRHYDFLESDPNLENYLVELFDERVKSNVYAIRNNYKWCPVYVKTKLGDSISDNLIANQTFLITGGLGGIGLTITEYLVNNTKGSIIILVGRSNTPKFSGYKHLLNNAIANQIKLLYIKCNIGLEKDVAFFTEKLNKLNINKLDIIIHAAGVGAKSALFSKKLIDIEKVILPKVNGTINLINLANIIQIGTLINCSSLSSITPSFGNMEYTAANFFMDEVSYRKYPHIDRIITINLNQIIDRGMAFNFISQVNNKQLSKNSIQSSEIPNILNKVLNALDNNIIISKRDIEVEVQNIYENNFIYTTPQQNPHIIEDKAQLKQKIADLFSEILGIDQININDSFFDLGGTSLAAIRLMSRLKNIGINLSLADIVTINSISKIYLAAENHIQDSLSTQIILPLQINNNSNKNVFFIHPVGGTVMLYLNMIKHLSKEFNYYGIQNINTLGSRLITASSLKELSKIYLKEILKIQPTGEYIFMGSSMGGTIAYEIANQLAIKKKKVKFIAMFDSWAIFSDVFYKKNNFKNAMNEQIKYETLLKNNFHASRNNLINARWELMKLLLQYKPQKANINIHLYKAMELDSLHITNGLHHDNGWQQYTNLPVTVYNIPGDHLSLHFSPGLNKLIALVNNSLLN